MPQECIILPLKPMPNRLEIKKPRKTKNVAILENQRFRVDHGNIGNFPPIPNSGGERLL